MDSKKVLEVIDIYKEYFLENGNVQLTDVTAHCYGMLEKMEKFILEGKMEKTFRWLGFIQGCLWSLGIYSLEDLKNHNRTRSN